MKKTLLLVLAFFLFLAYTSSNCFAQIPIDTPSVGAITETPDIIPVETIPDGVTISLSKAIKIAQEQTNATIYFAQLSFMDDRIVYFLEGTTTSAQQSVTVLINPATGDIIIQPLTEDGSLPKIKLAEAILIAEKITAAQAISSTLRPIMISPNRIRLAYGIALQKSSPPYMIAINIDIATGEPISFPTPYAGFDTQPSISIADAVDSATSNTKKEAVAAMLLEHRGQPVYNIQFEKTMIAPIVLDAINGGVVRPFFEPFFAPESGSD